MTDLSPLSNEDLAALTARKRWLAEARPNQLPPEGDWNILLWRNGRGFGKTRSISEVLWWEAWRCPGIRVHYVAPTLGDVRGTIFEGHTGLTKVMPESIIQNYNKSLHEIHLKNGSFIKGFAAVDEADRIRGPQCHVAGGDEVAAWDRPGGNLELAFTNLMLGCRLPYPDGTKSRAYLGTTPKPIPFLRKLQRRPDVRVITGSSHENLGNLSATFRETIKSLEGSALGRQEVYGEMTDAEEGAIFKRAWFKLWPNGKKLPDFRFVIESYYNAFGKSNYDAKKQEADESCSLVWGLFNLKQALNEQERIAMGIRPTATYGILLCDAWSEKISFPDLAEKARAQHKKKWGVPGKKSDAALVNESGSGLSLRQSLIQYGVETWPYNIGKEDTPTRAHAVSPLVQQGCVFLPESSIPSNAGLPRDWAEPMLEQVCAYAGEGSVASDNFVVALTQSLLYFRNKGMLVINPIKTLPADPEEERDKREAAERARRANSKPRENPYAA